MELSRDNFEIWLERWLDGSLNEDQAEKFMAFLLENHDITEHNELSLAARLKPETTSYHNKDKLRRDLSNLTTGQIEYLSVAFHENDLSPEAVSELKMNIAANDHGRKIFELTGKARLLPPDIRYPHKNSLKKAGASRTIFRLATEIISIAAVIMIVIMIQVLAPGSLSNQNSSQTSKILPIQENMPEYTIYRTDPIAAPAISTEIPVSHRIVAGSLSPSLAKASDIPGTDTGEGPSTDLTVPAAKPVAPAEAMTRINIKPFTAGLEFFTPPAMLIASSMDTRPDYLYEDRGRVRSFIASTFREKILKEEGEPWKPLQPYEIARAGVDGLNRLLDWNMELKETKSSEGETKSVYFSSMLLTFNAPVKKSSE
ncbi:MAG: hypothetical protein JXR66_09210 [Bacteroidales bacterium]|nr:hypothetical protein [Bacteroidales bacterium]MBN2633722.1 hypothetical protein [Bacteroidales bacterium]